MHLRKPSLAREARFPRPRRLHTRQRACRPCSGICVIVGFAAALDPAVNLMDAATPCLLAYSLTGRVAGRLYM